MTQVIVIEGLTKHYGRNKIPAVDELSLTISAGEVYGFLGSNGAGKSTTIRLVLDFIRPSSGTIRIFGKDSVRDSVAIKKDIGYLAGDVALPNKVTGRQLLHYLASLRGGVDKLYLAELEQQFQAQLDKRIGTLSKGNRQKIGLIQALMNKPKLMILDEPTSGLDPMMQEQFYKIIAKAKQDGTAVFLSSHSFGEVERICDRVGIIREGKLVYEGTVASVTANHVPAWNVVVAHKTDADALEQSKAVTVTFRQDRSLSVSPRQSIPLALAALSKVAITSMSTSQDDLENEFMSFYNQEPTK